MSPVNQLSILAFAAGALAVPGYRDLASKHGHHGHHRFHHSEGSASGSGAPFPYPGANSTGLWGTTGTGYATGSAAPSVYSASSESYTGPVVTVSPVPQTIETYVNAGSSSDCTTDVTVTTTQKTYITVTATSHVTSSDEVSATEGSSSSERSTSTIHVQSTVYYTPSASVEESSSSADAYTPSSSAVETSYSSSSAAAYTPSAYSSSVESSSSAEVSVAASSYEASTSSYVAPVTYSQVQKGHSYSAPAYSAPASSSVWSTSSTTSSAAATSTTASSSTGGGKRGLAYNDAGLTEYFMESEHMGFAYNWGSDASGFEKGSSNINYIPLLWGTSDEFTGSWSENAANAIKKGSEYLFGFNEPDLKTQSNLSPEEAADAWKTYMEPFAGQAKLCTPAVTNGGGEMGLTWLSNFLNACSGCTIDCASIHWYDSYSNADYFKNQVTNATEIAGVPVFVTEFGTTDGDDKDISGFLEEVMPWMDSNDDVAGYAYFMVSDGLLVSGSEMSPYGSTYATYSS